MNNAFPAILNNKNTTFDELSQLWILSKKEKLKQSTYLKYHNIIDKYLKPSIGRFALSEMDTQIIDNAIYKIYWKEENKHLSYSLMKTILFVTNAILKHGKRLHLMKALEITFELSNDEVSEIPVFSYNSTRKLKDYILSHSSDSSLGIIISLYMGLRIGEICSLQRKDIDFDKNIIHIRKTVQRLNTGKNQKTELLITKPKSKKSFRDIPIPLFLSELFREYMIYELESELFILGKKEKPYEPRTLQYGYRRILAECNITYMHFHCLRHTFATNCINSGFDIKTLSEILGHSSVNFTMNRYVHSDIEAKRRQMDLLNTYMC